LIKQTGLHNFILWSEILVLKIVHLIVSCKSITNRQRFLTLSSLVEGLKLKAYRQITVNNLWRFIIRVLEVASTFLGQARKESSYPVRESTGETPWRLLAPKTDQHNNNNNCSMVNNGQLLQSKNWWNKKLKPCSTTQQNVIIKELNTKHSKNHRAESAPRITMKQ